MGIVSIVLSVLALFFLGAGLLTAVVPILGSLFSFGAPVLALLAVILGGVSMSRARREGGDSGVGLAGVILGTLAFVPALLVALTCGMCNVCFSAAALNPNNPGIRFSVNQGTSGPRPARKAPPDDSAKPPPRPPDPHSPPPAFPPPPIAPGPAPQPDDPGR